MMKLVNPFASFFINFASGARVKFLNLKPTPMCF